jgi:parvulin-like peptidyl-prolyl isomerase
MTLVNRLGFIILVAFSGWAWAQGNYPGNAVRINGQAISNERFHAFYMEYRNSKGVAVGARGDQLELMKRLRKEAMDLMIEQELVRQAAEAKGIEVTTEEVDAAWAEITQPFKTREEFIRRLETESFTEEGYRKHLQRMLMAKKYLDEIRLSVPEVGDEELETYYRDNEIRLTLPEQVRVRHILLTWKPLGKPDDRAALYEQMQPILEKARAGEDFASLARQFSEDYATRQTDGDTGLFKRGDMPPAFEQAAFALQPGQISDIVETPFGLHIIKLEERQAPRLLPLAEIREPLRDHIYQEKMQAAVQQENARLLSQAEVQVLIPLDRK